LSKYVYNLNGVINVYVYFLMMEILIYCHILYGVRNIYEYEYVVYFVYTVHIGSNCYISFAIFIYQFSRNCHKPEQENQKKKN